MKIDQFRPAASAAKQRSLWQNVLLISILATGSVYALPNVYGNDPALLIDINQNKPDLSLADTEKEILNLLSQNELQVKASGITNNHLLVRFDEVDAQFNAYNIISQHLSENVNLTYHLAPNTPEWLTAIGASPLQLGLDLQGGVHLVYEVDLEAALNYAIENYAFEIRRALRDNGIRHTELLTADVTQSEIIQIVFDTQDEQTRALTILSDSISELSFSAGKSKQNKFFIIAHISGKTRHDITQRAMDKNINVLRNRVDLLGLSEPLVHQQGENRIVVELPGAYNSNEIKDLLGTTAALEFRLAYD